ncbi:unnamed protein product [Trichobilharzia regenti]|nr:unnamed protein product [Trichobilharzia regenti]
MVTGFEPPRGLQLTNATESPSTQHVTPSAPIEPITVFSPPNDEMVARVEHECCICQDALVSSELFLFCSFFRYVPRDYFFLDVTILNTPSFLIVVIMIIHE